MMKLGKFEILGKIGQGAMGIVYKARDPLIGRIVALKTITTGLAESPDLLNRFYGEAQSAGRLQHPNIVTIFELGSEGDTPFIAMEFLTGESLEKLIARRPKMPLSQKLGYIVRVCQALEYAHRQNPSVVHRDIKPANVMVTSDGTVKVVDFGIARLGEGSHSQSSGMLLGTLKYMSPQQFRGGSADARSDIWSTGIMFYELLCYHRPFDAENPGALVTSIMVDQHRSISEAAPGTPAEIEAIVDRMLCKELDGRYQNMEEVLMELEPVWHQVQQAAVANLVADGRRLFEIRDLARAEDIVREALQLDTSNTQAKSLLEKINAELRRIESTHEATARVKNGQDLLAKGQLEEAKAEAEAALRLDSTFQPARELLAQLQAATERARLLANALRASKQRLAEGALTEAELQLDTVLEMDPSNSVAQGLLQQIRNEKTRRERQVRLAEALRRARTLWTNLQYEECISVLLDAQKEFPGESEIARFLSTAREDHAEQQRQSLLGEARKLLSAQRFEETLKALDGLLERFPSDATARNLRTLALQGQEQEKREQRLNENLKNLRAMVEKENYQEVIESGQKLLQEFPHEFELAELIRFARNEQIQNEQKRRLDDWIRRIQQSVRDERFTAAIQDAQKALKEFPQDVELLILSERAKKKQDDKERENLLRQRLQEVEKRIERQEFAEAIDLARETLVTVGTHPGLASLLHRAEMEFEQRNKRKHEQDEALEKARTLLDAGALGEATLVLENAVETKLFAKSDPRFAPLLNEIDAKKQQRQVEEALKELRSLLAEGRHSEVIEKGKAMLRELPQDVELQELVDFAQEEISREQQRQEEKEREQEIQSFLEAGRFLDAEEAALRAANEYPKRTSFRRLLEEARRRKREEDERERLRQQIEYKKEEQRRKEEQERQVEAVRTVIERGNLAEATQLLHRAIAGKVFERSDVLAKQLETEIEERKREKEQKTADRERHLSEIQRLIREDKIEEASQALTQALDERVLDGNDARTLEIKKSLEDKKKLFQFKKEEEERKRKNQEWVISRIKELISKQELADADQLLSETVKNGLLPGTHEAVRQLRAHIQEATLRSKERDREERARLEGQDHCLSEARTLTKSGDFAKATLLLDQAVGSGLFSADEERVLSMRAAIEEEARIADIRRKEEARRLERQTARLNEVEALLRSGETSQGAALLDRAVREGMFPVGDSRVAQRQNEIRQKEMQRKAQQEDQVKQQKQKLELKRREAREALGQGDFYAALRIAKEGLAEFGSNAELAELVGRAEAAIGKEEIEKRNRDELLQRIGDHLNSGNISAADLLLNNSLKNGALKKSDSQVAVVADKLKTLAEEERKKRNELRQTRSRMQDLIKKRRFPEAVSAGQNFLSLHGFQEGIAELVKQAEVSNTNEEAFQKRRQTEVETVRGLLSEGNAAEAKRFLAVAIRQGILQQDPEVKKLSKQIDADLKIQAKSEGKTPAMRVPFAVGAAILLLAGSYGIYRMVKGQPPEQPTVELPEPKWLQEAQADIDANPHQFRKANDLLRRIINSPTVQSAIKQQASQLQSGVQSKIQDEDDLRDRGNQALRQRDCKNAGSLFDQLIAINGDHLDEATAGRAKASDPSNCEADPSVLVKKTMAEADRAFAKQDWSRAKSLYELVLTNPAASAADIALAKTRLQLADKYIADVTRRKAEDEAKAAEIERRRMEEEALWNQANAAKSSAGQDRAKLEAAQSLFRKVSSYGLTHKLQADQEVANIDSLIAGIEKGEQERVCGQNWMSLSTDYYASVENRDEKKLNSLKGSLEQFSRTSCTQADQARTLSAKIPGLIAGWNASAPTTKVEPERTGPNPENNAIYDLIEVQLAAAFRQKDVKQILALWPSPYLAKEDQQKWRNTFQNSKAYSRNFKISKIEDRGADEKEVSGSYAGEVLRNDGVREPLTGNFDARVIRQQGRWIIKNITW